MCVCVNIIIYIVCIYTIVEVVYGVSRKQDRGMALNAVKYVKSLKTCRPVKKKKKNVIQNIKILRAI